VSEVAEIYEFLPVVVILTRFPKQRPWKLEHMVNLTGPELVIDFYFEFYELFLDFGVYISFFSKWATSKLRYISIWQRLQ
jgi:hypothetical protein